MDTTAATTKNLTLSKETLRRLDLAEPKKDKKKVPTPQQAPRLT
jgi:hypothetical protein